MLDAGADALGLLVDKRIDLTSDDIETTVADAITAIAAAVVDTAADSADPRIDLAVEVLPPPGAGAGSDVYAIVRAAVGAGATIIIDHGARLGSVAAELGVGWVAVADPGEPDDSFAARMSTVEGAGVAPMWLDPGLAQAPDPETYLGILSTLDRLTADRWPVAVDAGPSPALGRLVARSDGSELPVQAGEQVMASVGVATVAMACGVLLIRVHDVDEAQQAATVFTGATSSRSRS